MPGLEIPVSNTLTVFQEEASDALSKLSDRLPTGTTFALIVYTPGNLKMDNGLKDNGLCIDGDNAYKRDLCDAIVGALAMGAQNTNPPPADHWGQRFWDIGREERASSEKLLKALTALTQIAGECEQIASNYSGTIDGIFEHGGDDHEDPSCAIFHRLYYAMFDARAAIKKAIT